MAKINPWKLTTVILAGALATSFGLQTVRSANADGNFPQPDMNAALTALTNAQTSLAAGADNHGGHRATALTDTTNAIAEVKAGILYANTHGGPHPVPGPHPR